jgi:hypothetical protein
MIVHLLDIEWLLSTLFDASLFNFRAAGNGGSFFALSHFGSNREAACAAAEAEASDAANCSPSVLESVAGRQLCLHVRSSGAGHGGGAGAILSPEWRNKTKNFCFCSVAWGV